MSKTEQELTDEGELLVGKDNRAAIALFNEALALDPHYRRANCLKKEAYRRGTHEYPFQRKTITAPVSHIGKPIKSPQYPLCRY